MATLEEIFKYLAKADKPCIVAVDEFQQITNYSEKNVEALLRTHIQHCNNAQFICGKSASYDGEYVPKRISPVLSERLYDAP